jgi:hypothetical protein
MRRPAFQFTVYAALAALCLPLYPMIPPAFLFTVLYRRLWWQARVFRAYRDLARLPLTYLAGGGRLPDGEAYGGRRYEDIEGIRELIAKEALPLIVPEKAAGGKRRDWYVFGALGGEGALPQAPRDPQATWGALPGEPERLARSFTRRAYGLEILSWLLLLAGIGLNVFSIALILAVVIRF